MVCKLQTIWTFACISWLILWVISAVQLQLHAVLIDSDLGFWQEIFVTFHPSGSKTSVRILILERYSMKNPNSKVHGFRIIELIVLLLCYLNRYFHLQWLTIKQWIWLFKIHGLWTLDFSQNTARVWIWTIQDLKKLIIELLKFHFFLLLNWGVTNPWANPNSCLWKLLNIVHLILNMWRQDSNNKKEESFDLHCIANLLCAWKKKLK